MSYKIRIPSENPDRVGRFAITSGTPDAIITFPNESGEVATTSDIPQGGSTTTYVLQNTYTDATTDDPQVITEWDVPIVAGKLYKFEYGLSARTNESSSGWQNIFRIYYQTSSFTNPLVFGLAGSNASYFYAAGDDPTDLSTPSSGVSLAGGPSAIWVFETLSGTFIATETGTLRHLVQGATPWTPGAESSSYVAGESYLQVTQLN